jgi:hypothetical protein
MANRTQLQLKIERERDAEGRRALDTADQRMKQAKHKFSLAALACLRGRPDAERQVRDALQEVDRARAALRAAGEQ